MQTEGTRQKGYLKCWWDCNKVDIKSFGLPRSDAQDTHQWRIRIKGNQGCWCRFTQIMVLKWCMCMRVWLLTYEHLVSHVKASVYGSKQILQHLSQPDLHDLQIDLLPVYWTLQRCQRPTPASSLESLHSHQLTLITSFTHWEIYEFIFIITSPSTNNCRDYLNLSYHTSKQYYQDSCRFSALTLIWRATAS